MGEEERKKRMLSIPWLSGNKKRAVCARFSVLCQKNQMVSREGYFQISSSVGTCMRVCSGATRVMLSRCLKVKFSEMELLPHEPQPRVLVTGRPFCMLPPAVVAQGAFTIRRDTLSSEPALMMLAWELECRPAVWLGDVDGLVEVLVGEHGQHGAHLLLADGVVDAEAAVALEHQHLGAVGDADAGLLRDEQGRLAYHLARRVALLEEHGEHLLALLGRADVGVVLAEGGSCG